MANRTDYDLKTHSEKSGEDLSFFDQETGEPGSRTASSRLPAWAAR